MDRDLHFYEMEDPKVGKDVRMVDSILTRPKNIENQTPLEASGSYNLIGSVHMEQDHEMSQLRHSNRKRIPRRHFEIEGEAFMITMIMNSLKQYNKLSLGLMLKKWFEAMEEEMNSMKSNRVWDLVDFLPSHRIVGNKWVLIIKR